MKLVFEIKELSLKQLEALKSTAAFEQSELLSWYLDSLDLKEMKILSLWDQSELIGLAVLSENQTNQYLKRVLERCQNRLSADTIQTLCCLDLPAYHQGQTIEAFEILSPHQSKGYGSRFITYLKQLSPSLLLLSADDVQEFWDAQDFVELIDDFYAYPKPVDLMN